MVHAGGWLIVDIVHANSVTWPTDHVISDSLTHSLHPLDSICNIKTHLLLISRTSESISEYCLCIRWPRCVSLNHLLKHSASDAKNITPCSSKWEQKIAKWKSLFVEFGDIRREREDNFSAACPNIIGKPIKSQSNYRMPINNKETNTIYKRTIAVMNTPLAVDILSSNLKFITLPQAMPNATSAQQNHFKYETFLITITMIRLFCSHWSSLKNCNESQPRDGLE